MSDDDDRLLGALGDALARPEASSGPPADRVAALRAAAEARRSAGAAAGAEVPDPAVAPGAPRRPSRRGLLGMGVAAAAGAVAGIGVREALREEPPEPPYQDVAFAATPPGVTVTSSRVIDHTWGLELILDVDGLPAGRRHDVRFVGLDGATTDAGGFLGVGGPLVCRCNGPRRKADLRAIEVVADGEVVLRAQLV